MNALAERLDVGAIATLDRRRPTVRDRKSVV